MDRSRRGLARLPHLVRRFFRSLRARRPDAATQLWVATLLTRHQASVFWEQPVADQVHAVRVARAVEEAAPQRADLMCAALLHDIGKRHARLGTMGRSAATVRGWFGLVGNGRVRAYLDHPARGADELRALGAGAVVVAFAEHHHDERPAQIDPDDWRLLIECDDE